MAGPRGQAAGSPLPPPPSPASAPHWAPSSLGDPSIYLGLFHQTTSNNVQSIIESRVEKRTKGVYVPFGGKSMITFMDDLNMPAKDMFGSQPPLELIRLWIDYGFWYDRTKQTIKYIRVSIPGVCLPVPAPLGPPGMGAPSPVFLPAPECPAFLRTRPPAPNYQLLLGTLLLGHPVLRDQRILSSSFHSSARPLTSDSCGNTAATRTACNASPPLAVQ